MILFPAIDLLDGRVVRLRRGERSRVDVYSADASAVEVFAGAESADDLIGGFVADLGEDEAVLAGDTTNDKE